MKILEETDMHGDTVRIGTLLNGSLRINVFSALDEGAPTPTYIAKLDDKGIEGVSRIISALQEWLSEARRM